MRLAALALAALALSASTAVGGRNAPGGSLSIEDGRGVVKIVGRGVLVGRIDRGSLEIQDLSPADQWSPRVNGVPRGRVVGLRGQNVLFFVPGGRYRIVARGEGISISARGAGQAVIDGEPDANGAAGTFAIGDDVPQPLPETRLRLVFPAPDVPAPVDSGKLRP